MWPLASEKALAISDVHGYMLDLPNGISDLLMHRTASGRYYRFPTPRLTEVEWLSAKSHLGAFMGLIALIREAELDQDLGIYMAANGALR